MTTKDELDQIGARVYGLDNAGEANPIGARVYGYSEESNALGARVYGQSDELDTLGARVYGHSDHGTVSYEQPTDDDNASNPAAEEVPNAYGPNPKPWRLDEVRPANAVNLPRDDEDDLDAIGARVASRRGASSVVSIDNRDASGLFDPYFGP